MREVFEEAIRSAAQHRPGVLATVVHTRGSSPQKAGAKMLVRRDGSTVGTLGGGCVEGDIWYIAREMLRKEEGPQFRKYTLTEELAARDGLVCGGTMFFFLEPIHTGESFLSFARAVITAWDNGIPLAAATIVHSAAGNCRPGNRLLFYEDGATAGTLGDPQLEEIVRRVGKRLMIAGDNEYLQKEKEVAIYVEGFTSTPALYLLGGGHVGKAVSTLAATLGFRIIVIDDREEFANKERFPEARKNVVAGFAEGLQQQVVNANSYILIATRGHHHDDLALEAAIRTPARYIGLLGSKRKSLLICRKLHQQGVPLERIREIRAPVGLNIGAITPEELAVSIMAEIIACRRGGDGRPMKMEVLEEQIKEKGKRKKSGN